MEKKRKKRKKKETNIQFVAVFCQCMNLKCYYSITRIQYMNVYIEESCLYFLKRSRKCGAI